MRTTTPKRFLIIVTAAIVFSLLLRHWGFERIYVASPSMEPAMPRNSRWWTEKFTFLLREPRRGEVIVFVSPVDSKKDLIKRVIGISGDTVEIKNKAVYLNGVELKEDYVIHVRRNQLLRGDDLGPIVVPRDCVFVLGDNRDESGDSRDWRDLKTLQPIYFVPIGKIKARVLIPYYLR